MSIHQNIFLQTKSLESDTYHYAFICINAVLNCLIMQNEPRLPHLWRGNLQFPSTQWRSFCFSENVTLNSQRLPHMASEFKVAHQPSANSPAENVKCDIWVLHQLTCACAGPLVWCCGRCWPERCPIRTWTHPPSSGEWATTVCSCLCPIAVRIASNSCSGSAGEQAASGTLTLMAALAEKEIVMKEEMSFAGTASQETGLPSDRSSCIWTSPLQIYYQRLRKHISSLR